MQLFDVAADTAKRDEYRDPVRAEDPDWPASRMIRYKEMGYSFERIQQLKQSRLKPTWEMQRE